MGFVTHFERRNTCGKDWGVRMFSCIWPVICHVRIDRVRCSCSPPRSRDAERSKTGPFPRTLVPSLFIKTPQRVWEWNKQMIPQLILHNVVRVWLRRCLRLSDCFFYCMSAHLHSPDRIVLPIPKLWKTAAPPLAMQKFISFLWLCWIMSRSLWVKAVIASRTFTGFPAIANEPITAQLKWQ